MVLFYHRARSYSTLRLLGAIEAIGSYLAIESFTEVLEAVPRNKVIYIQYYNTSLLFNPAICAQYLEPYCCSTKTQVYPGSALKRPKHHPSDQSIVLGILGSSRLEKLVFHSHNSSKTSVLQPPIGFSL